MSQFVRDHICKKKKNSFEATLFTPALHFPSCKGNNLYSSTFYFKLSFGDLTLQRSPRVYDSKNEQVGTPQSPDTAVCYQNLISCSLIHSLETKNVHCPHHCSFNVNTYYSREFIFAKQSPMIYKQDVSFAICHIFYNTYKGNYWR